jgi:hypothetical protein
VDLVGNTIEKAGVTGDRNKTGQFVDGHSKRGGRKPGIKNWSARAIAEAAGFDPLTIMLEVVRFGYLPLTAGEDPINRKKVSDELRVKTLLDLNQYVYPRLSATQLTGANDAPLAVATMDLFSIMADPELARAAQTLALGIAQQSPARIEDNEE